MQEHVDVSTVLLAGQELDMFAIGSHRLHKEQICPLPQYPALLLHTGLLVVDPAVQLDTMKALGLLQEQEAHAVPLP